MKKIIFSILTILLISFRPVMAQGQNNPLVNTESVQNSPKIQIRQTLQEKKQKRLELLQQNREEIKEQIQTKRETFKEKIREIKNEKKQKIMVRIDTQLAYINEITTNRMSNTLSRLNALLDKLSSRVNKGKTEGLETAAAGTAITTAESAIAAASQAVTEQAGKDYVIEFTNESGLKISASNTKTTLRKDLKVVRELIKTAHQAVTKVLGSVRTIYKNQGE